MEMANPVRLVTSGFCGPIWYWNTQETVRNMKSTTVWCFRNPNQLGLVVSPIYLQGFKNIPSGCLGISSITQQLKAQLAKAKWILDTPRGEMEDDHHHNSPKGWGNGMKFMGFTESNCDYLEYHLKNNGPFWTSFDWSSGKLVTSRIIAGNPPFALGHTSKTLRSCLCCTRLL